MSPVRPRVLCLADLAVAPAARALLQQHTDLIEMPPRRDLLLRTLPECDIYFATLHLRFDQEAFSCAPRLRLIATPSTGTDHIDLEEARRRGIRVLSLRGETEFLERITSTAELAWGLLLAVVRKIPAGFAAAQRGEWARDRFRGHQLAGKTLGILGYGRLGKMVAQYGLAFRMRVLACDVHPFEAPNVQRVDFDALLAESDVLSVHVPLTEENRGLLSRAAFAKMKPGIVLINTSRGAILDEAALLEALESGRVAGAGLDVIEGEWRDDLAEHPLIRYARQHENLVITPHVGGVTYEAQALVLEFMARKLLEAWCKGTLKD